MMSCFEELSRRRTPTVPNSDQVMTITDAMRQTIRRFEGVTTWMYRDIVGGVTVGVGKHLPADTDAAALPFNDTAGRPASAADIKTAWAKVRAATLGKPADFYKQFSDVRMTDQGVADQLEKDLVQFEKQLKVLFKDYDKFPAKAQEGCMDMLFNLGFGTIKNKFPKFLAACEKMDWKVAATESVRPQVAKERNDHVAALFNAA